MKVAQCVEIYIERKEACGYTYTSIAKVLRRFARFVGRMNITCLTDHHVNAFLRRSAISNNTWRHYSLHLRRLFLYWFARRQIRRIPKPDPKPSVAKTFYPHIYTRTEIRRLLDAAATCQRAPRCMIGSKTLRTIVLFLYATGAKIGDALAVLGSDVDFAHSSILIRSASSLETRVIPIGRDVRRLLRRHLKSDERTGFGLGSTLFLTVKGKAVPYAVLCTVFRKLRKIADVKRANSSYQPRVNDLRHTFAVHSIAEWTRAGLANDKMLPILATYMGNVHMRGLERYLELSPCTYEAQLDRLKVLTTTR